MSVISWLLIATLVATAAGAWLLWLLGWPTIPKRMTFTTTEMLDLLKIGLAVVAGFGGVVALAVNYRKQRTTEAAHALTLSQEERERTKLFNERFKAAAEQLSSDQVSLRIAGVAAMAGLADDWEAQRQVCVEVLIDHLKLPKDEHDPEVANKIFRALRNQLGTHRRPGPWSPLNFDFSGVRFVDADFSERTFAGEVIFNGAKFTGDHTSFERTAFRDTLSCHGAVFTDTTVSFRDTFFDNTNAEFVGCTFTRSEIDFRGTELTGRALYFYQCTFEDSGLIGGNSTLNTGSIRVERCKLDQSKIDMRDVVAAHDDSRSLGYFFMESTIMDGGELLLRSLYPKYQWVWLRDNTFTDVHTEIGEGSATWLKIRGGKPEELPTT